MGLPSVLTNPLFGGGAILMLSGFVLALARNIPLQIWGWMKRRVTISVAITNADPCFDWLIFWLNEHPYTKKARRLVVSTQKGVTSKEEDIAYDEGYGDSSVRIIFSPSPGNHFLSYKNKWIWLRRGRKDAVPSNGGNLFSLMRPEEFTFTMMGRNQQVIRELIQEAYALLLAQQAR